METLYNLERYLSTMWVSMWKDRYDEEDQMKDRLRRKPRDPNNTLPETVVELKVGLHCEECRRIVTEALWGLEGVEQVDIDKNSHKVTVTGTLDAQQVLEHVEGTGKHVEFWPPQKEPSNEGNASNNATASAELSEEEEESGGCIVM